LNLANALESAACDVKQRIAEITGVSAKPSNADHPEVYEKLNWEDRTGNKGAFQMLKKDNCRDTQLFTHLENILRQNKNNISIGNWHYWAGDTGFIFRRKKKSSS
jgi:hypothetical protein